MNDSKVKQWFAQTSGGINLNKFGQVPAAGQQAAKFSTSWQAEEFLKRHLYSGKAVPAA